jgi:hypothetical protein
VIEIAQGHQPSGLEILGAEEDAATIAGLHRRFSALEWHAAALDQRIAALEQHVAPLVQLSIVVGQQLKALNQQITALTQQFTGFDQHIHSYTVYLPGTSDNGSSGGAQTGPPQSP